MTNHILHLDMDAFFASVEQRDHPEWRGRPVVVGAPPDQRGVVSTASYEARVFGVHSAMPSREAYRLCPHAIFVPGDHHHYHEVSQQVMAILHSVSPLVEQVSVDEAFLDLAGVLGAEGHPVETAELLRRRIRTELRLTASVGVASNMFLAKLASDLHKPDGLTVVPEPPDEIAAFLAPLPIGRIWGVGAKTGELLRGYGLRTIGDLQRASADMLRRVLGAAYGPRIHDLAFGRDDRQVQPEPPPEKSLSQEHTFLEDCGDFPVVRAKLRELAELVGARLRRHGLFAGCAFLKLRYADFRTITRQLPIRPATDLNRDLLAHADRLLDATGLPARPVPVRLVGFGVTALQDTPGNAPRQLSLFPEENQAAEDQRLRQQKDRQLDRTLDALRSKFGPGVIRRP